jgi:hypothetical protein
MSSLSEIEIDVFQQFGEFHAEVTSIGNMLADRDGSMANV